MRSQNSDPGSELKLEDSPLWLDTQRPFHYHNLENEFLSLFELSKGSAAVKNLLIVDDDHATRNHLSYEFKPYEEIIIHHAEDARQAARLLDSHSIDLVITELDLPDIDGLKLLAYLKKRFPATRSMAMARNYSRRMESGMTHFKVTDHFTKPLDMDVVVESVLQELGISGGGRIHGISLASFLQLVDLEQKTCTLIVKSKNKRGRIFCRLGNVIAAEAEGDTGKRALYRLLFWDRAVIQVEEGCRNNCPEIDQPLMYLLMEGHRMQDEVEEAEPAAVPVESDKEAEIPVPLDNGPSAPESRMQETDPLQDRIDTLAALFNRAPEIDEYAIFDPRDRLRERRFRPGFPESLSPSVYFEAGEKLAGLLGSGPFKYLDLTISGRMRYSIYKHEQLFIVLGLRPGNRVPALIRKYQLQN
jgi:CheY-like chemotaxis protein